MKSKALITAVATFALAKFTVGSTITLNPGVNVQFRLNSARAGDVVQFNAGTFNLGAIALPTGA